MSGDFDLSNLHFDVIHVFHSMTELRVITRHVYNSSIVGTRHYNTMSIFGLPSTALVTKCQKTRYFTDDINHTLRKLIVYFVVYLNDSKILLFFQIIYIVYRCLYTDRENTKISQISTAIFHSKFENIHKI